MQPATSSLATGPQGSSSENASSQAFIKKDKSTHVSFLSNFTVCLAHLVLLQGLQAERKKESVVLEKPSQPLAACTPLLQLWGCLALSQPHFRGSTFPAKAQWQISTDVH